jgi:RNA polymerase sigma-70 factor (ECF subfamily)
MRVRSERRRRADPLDAAHDVPAPDRADTVLGFNALQQAVMALPDELRTVFVLKHVEGYAHDEIAALLEISAGASRVRLNRAVAMLRRSLV